MNLRRIIDRYRALPVHWQLVIAGGITGLSFPPLPLAFLAWVGLIPLIYAWRNAPTPGQAGLMGWYWSLGYLVVVLYWLTFNTGTNLPSAFASMVGTVLILSVNYLAIGWWYGWLRKHMGALAIWLLPSIWVAVEYIRTFGSLGLPWVALANGQTIFFLPIQNAEITGIYGISFWVVMLNVLMAELLEASDKRPLAASLAGAIVLPWLTGWLLLPEPETGHYRVSVIQPNVNAAEKWDPQLRHDIFAQLDAMTREVAVDSPAVVLWPEAAAPAYLRYGGQSYLRDIQQLVKDIRAPIVTGIPDYERIDAEEVRYFNSVAHIDSTGIIADYIKIRLVPFAEAMPPLLRLLGISDILGVSLGEFAAGDEYTVFEVDEVRFSVGICFETSFPDVYRQFARHGATILVGAVNDGWYNNGLSSGPYQHAAQLRYRAIELRRPAVRVANTGISMIIDATGRVTQRIPLNEAGSFTAAVVPSEANTFYYRFGDLFAWLNLLISVSLSLRIGWRQRPLDRKK